MEKRLKQTYTNAISILFFCKGTFRSISKHISQTGKLGTLIENAFCKHSKLKSTQHIILLFIFKWTIMEIANLDPLGFKTTFSMADASARNNGTDSGPATEDAQTQDVHFKKE